MTDFNIVALHFSFHNIKDEIVFSRPYYNFYPVSIYVSVFFSSNFQGVEVHVLLRSPARYPLQNAHCIQFSSECFMRNKCLWIFLLSLQQCLPGLKPIFINVGWFWPFILLSGSYPNTVAAFSYSAISSYLPILTNYSYILQQLTQTTLLLWSWNNNQVLSFYMTSFVMYFALV